MQKTITNLKIYVVDNSVILKPILNEEGAEKVKKLFLLKNKFKISIFVPDIFCYEFFNKLIKTLGAKVSFKAFYGFLERQVSIMPLQDDLIMLANKLVEKYPKISFYDAAYHALAKAYNAELITADERYYNQTKKEGNIKLLKNLKI